MHWSVPWSLPRSSALWTRTFTVPGWTILRTRRLASARRATQTVVLLPQLHLVPLLIAESWVERCEERLWVWTERVYELRDKDRKRGWSRGHGACWSWGTERLPAASVQHKGEWASRYREELSNSLFFHIHFYPACFKTVVPEWNNFCTDNAHWRNQIQLFKINCCSQMFTKWNLIVYIWDLYNLNSKFARQTFDLAHFSCLFVVLFNKKWNVGILQRCETKSRSTQTLSWFTVDNESWEVAPSVKWWSQTALLLLLLHIYYRNWGLVETWAETSMQSVFWW